MFKIDSGRHTKMAVKWPGLLEDGSRVENEVTLNIELVDRSDLLAQIRAESSADDPVESSEFFCKVVKGWDGVGDADGKPLPFSVDALKRLMEVPAFLPAAGEAYRDAWAGISGIREKNLETSPGVGSGAGEASQTKAA